MTRKGSVHVEDLIYRKGGFRVEWDDPENPVALIAVAIQKNEDQTFDLSASEYNLRGTYDREQDRYAFNTHERLVDSFVATGISEKELSGILGEIGPLEFVPVYGPKAPDTVPDLSTAHIIASKTRATTIQSEPPPVGPNETERANTPSPNAPRNAPGADQKDRSETTREGAEVYDPVMMRILAAEEARLNLWSASKVADVYKALTSNGVPMAYQDPRIQAYWRVFNDPERKFAQLKLMSGVSIFAGVSVGLGVVAAPSLASGAVSAAQNVRLAASMGSPGAAAFSLMASYPRLSLATMDMMAGLAEMPSVSGAAAKRGGSLLPKLPGFGKTGGRLIPGLKMTKFTVGKSSQNALFNTAANTASEVVMAAVPNNCFPADTRVLVSKGSKPIQDVRIGDEVWSYDETRRTRALNRVTRTFRSVADEIFTIEFDNDEIQTTPGHPFWVQRRGWTRAEDLTPGDTMQTADGRPLRVENTALQPQREHVFNFEVGVAHTYYVSTSGTLVHNNSGSNAAAIVRQTVGMPATQMLYTGEAKGLVVSYSRYQKMRAWMSRVWKNFQGHHLVENHPFAYAKDPNMRPLGNYVPTLVATETEHLSTIHTGLNAALKAAGLYQKRNYTNKELLKAINVSHAYYSDPNVGLGHMASAIKQFKEQVFMPMYRKNPNG